MKFGLTPKEISVIKGVFDEFSQIKEVIIFGSRAMGNFKQASDIDLAVVGGDISLSLIGKVKMRLEETIPVPYFFDIVNIKTTADEALKKHIEKHGRSFYKKNKCRSHEGQ